MSGSPWAEATLPYQECFSLLLSGALGTSGPRRGGQRGLYSPCMTGMSHRNPWKHFTSHLCASHHLGG